MAPQNMFSFWGPKHVQQFIPNVEPDTVPCRNSSFCKEQWHPHDGLPLPQPQVRMRRSSHWSAHLTETQKVQLWLVVCSMWDMFFKKKSIATRNVFYLNQSACMLDMLSCFEKVMRDSGKLERTNFWWTWNWTYMRQLSPTPHSFRAFSFDEQERVYASAIISQPSIVMDLHVGKPEQTCFVTFGILGP